jgi:hypothetical protein
MELTQLLYQDSRTKTYPGSPSIARLPSGDLLASHDYFGPGAPRSLDGMDLMTSIYRSGDDGETWDQVTHVVHASLSNLFVHRGRVYLLGTSQYYGSIVIRRSEDGGYTWTHPEDSKSGLLFEAGPRLDLPNYHCSAMPLLNHRGRLYGAFEDVRRPAMPIPGTGGVLGNTGLQSFVLSIAEEDDLLDASRWTMSNRLDLGPEDAPREWRKPADLNWREGNVVVNPDGEIWNILCVKSQPHIPGRVETAAVVKVSEDGSRVSFDPETGFIDFPGGKSKFTIRRDESTGTYWTLTNDVTNPALPNQRNVLSFYNSSDLVSWRRRATLLEDDSGLSPEESDRLTGFQYADWEFDGDDIYYLLRTAYDGAHNFHDANRITFHRIKDFRELTD